MKKKLFIMLGILIVLLFSLSLTTSYIDSARVRNSVEPKYTIKVISEDGNKVTYWGLGYKVIRYPSVSPNEPYKNNRGIKYGGWFMEYKLPSGNENLDIVRLQQMYPQFFNISTDGGLTVYIWQMAENSYSCYLTNTFMEAISDNSFAYKIGATITEMRAILDTYKIDRTKITIHPVINPLSSYYYEIDDTYRANLEELFWKD